MSLARAFIFAILAVALPGCPPPPVGHLHNNTSRPIEYCSGWWLCTKILSGQTREVTLTYSQPFRFSIREPTRELDYKFMVRAQRAYARREPESNCPNCPRYYFQLEPDMRLFILPPEVTPPVAPLPVQPAGFPLEPSERAA
jgi:hypothetical protein